MKAILKIMKSSLLKGKGRLQGSEIKARREQKEKSLRSSTMTWKLREGGFLLSFRHSDGLVLLECLDLPLLGSLIVVKETYLDSASQRPSTTSYFLKGNKISLVTLRRRVHGLPGLVLKTVVTKVQSSFLKPAICPSIRKHSNK